MKDLQQLAQEALALQDACNPAGVAGALQRTLGDLMRLGMSTTEAGRHPISLVIIDKLMDLTGMETRAGIDDWSRVHDLVNSKNNIDRMAEAVREGGK